MKKNTLIFLSIFTCTALNAQKTKKEEIRMSLSEKTCVPCKGDSKPLTQAKIDELTKETSGWQLVQPKMKKVLGGTMPEGPQKLEQTFKFKNFKESIEFVNKVAELAEKEGHHPDIAISWNKVNLTLFTHAISGLSENDFILAAKIDLL